MEADTKRIGAKIRYYRVQAGLSQERLAEISGLSRVYVGTIERGEKEPRLETITKLANALHVTTDDILQTGNARSTAAAELENILMNCSREEREIILKSARSLSEILKEYKLSK